MPALDILSELRRVLGGDAVLPRADPATPPCRLERPARSGRLALLAAARTRRRPRGLCRGRP